MNLIEYLEKLGNKRGKVKDTIYLYLQGIDPNARIPKLDRKYKLKKKDVYLTYSQVAEKVGSTKGSVSSIFGRYGISRLRYERSGHDCMYFYKKAKGLA